MPSTIKDVSKVAGVSTATVSNVITGKKYVGPELHQKVVDAMNKLSYKPNIMARSLKVNKTFKISVVVPNIANPFFSEIIKVIEESLDGTEYQMILYNTNSNPQKENEVFKALVENNQNDGIILVGARLSDEILNYYWKLPIVLADHPIIQGQNNLSFIVNDNFKASKEIANVIYEKGFKKFACITGPEESPSAKVRLSGFLSKLEECGVDTDEVSVYKGEFSFEHGYNSAIKLAKKIQKENEKTGVFICSDLVAWGAMEGFKKMGLEIAQDVGIISYDDIFYAKYLHPGLTTYHNSTNEIGKKAATMILRLLSSGANFTTLVDEVDGWIEYRESI